MGKHCGDYLNNCKFHNSNFINDNQFEEKYVEIQKSTAQLLKNEAEIFCLQEVMEENRPLVKALTEKGFKIVHFKNEKGFQTAIALSQDRFKDIVDHSFAVDIAKNFKRDVAIATATDKISGQKFTFVSAYVPGFELEKIYFSPKDTNEGDLYCKEIVKKLSQIGNHMIIGSDMNANPEKWMPRFEIFSENRFQLHRTNATTNVNPYSDKLKQREIDFIFTKTITIFSVWQKIKSLFFSTIQCNASINPIKPIDFNVEHNASDHLPIFVKVDFKKNISKIQELWNAAWHLFSGCFGTAQQQIN
jgi:exonuclease III